MVLATNFFDWDYLDFSVGGKVRIPGFEGMADTVCGSRCL